MSADQQCPCGSGTAFTKCCKPLLDNHSIAKTAEQLMRSRYTAFTMQENDYLLQSWAQETRPETLDSEEGAVRWIGLQVEETEKGGEGDDTGTVCFTATFIVSTHLCQLHEKSNFIKKDNQWFYLDGIPESTTKKITRNAKCPCGSGKKFKRCCI